MLLLSKISNLEMHSPEWKAARIGRLFTSSSIHYIMGKEGLGDTGMTYIRRKVFEALSGVSTDKEIDTDAVRWGLVYEPDNCRKFCAKMGIEFLVTQKMIEVSKEESTTPDGLIVRKYHTDGLQVDVTTFEAKCYQADKFMKCAECDTVQDVKKVDPSAYYQVLHQMMAVDCLNGFLSYYHPDLPLSAGLKIFEFRKMQQEIDKKTGKTIYPIIEDLKLMNERKKEALVHFERIKNKLLTGQ